MKRKKLSRIVDDLAVQSYLRKSAIFALVHAVNPKVGFRLRYSMHAVAERFTADEVRGIDEFFRWASMREDSLKAQELHGPLTRKDLVEAFDEFVSTRKGKLEEILRIDRADGENGVWRKWAKIVLDTDEVPNENEEESATVGERK
jgi:hypothetical protein